MSYSRPASTFHSIETGPKVGIALYFGSDGSDDWYDPNSVSFAQTVEQELSRLGSQSKPVPAPAVPSRQKPAVPQSSPPPPLSSSKSISSIAPRKLAPALPKSSVAPVVAKSAPPPPASRNAAPAIPPLPNVVASSPPDASHAPPSPVPPAVPAPAPRAAMTVSTSPPPEPSPRVEEEIEYEYQCMEELPVGTAPAINNAKGGKRSSVRLESMFVRSASVTKLVRDDDVQVDNSDSDFVPPSEAPPPPPDEAAPPPPEPTPRADQVISVQVLEKPPASVVMVAKPVLNLSADCDFSTMDVLPDLPLDPPPMSSQKEYKNYMKLKYELQRRFPDMVFVQPANPAPTPTTQRRMTSLSKAKSPPPVRPPAVNHAAIAAISSPPPPAPAAPIPVVATAPTPAPPVLPPYASAEVTVDSVVDVARPVQQKVAPAVVAPPPPPQPVVVVEEVIESDEPSPSPRPGSEHITVAAPPPPRRPQHRTTTDIMQYSDGSRYLGEMVAGVKHGKGFVVYRDGSTFEGNFMHGLRQGLGTRTTLMSQDVFRGMYQDDEKHGPGWMFGEDGSEDFCYYSHNERHGCGTFRWPRGTVFDRQYDRGKLLSEHRVEEQQAWPPQWAPHYERPSGYTFTLRWTGPHADFVCIVGSWDGFTKVIPLGYNPETDSHALCIILSRASSYWFRFIFNETECTAPNNAYPVEPDEHGVLSHVMRV